MIKIDDTPENRELVKKLESTIKGYLRQADTQETRDRLKATLSDFIDKNHTQFSFFDKYTFKVPDLDTFSQADRQGRILRIDVVEK